jgi:hypothetical protein
MEGSRIALGQADRPLAIVVAEENRDSNWSGAAAEEGNIGPEAQIGGEGVLEDEFCMEEEEEAEPEPARPKVWRMFARYYSMKAVNIDTIHTHFLEVWRIRAKMTFTPLKDNFFIITFSSEGDYRFVDGGGPWIHQGVACLIAPFVDNAQPSETVLNSVRLWVRFYDVPWNKQTDAYGRLIGSKLGKVAEVDVDTDGIKLNEFLRVRIDWPLNQRLLARFRTTIKGQAMVFPMRYERVPFFCFHCGFIGHSKDQCERTVLGTPSLHYDEMLQCSPKRKFEGRSVTTKEDVIAKKSLRFTSPEASVNSSNLGRPRTRQAAVTKSDNTAAMEIPAAVDACDGFEANEFRTGADVETALANTVLNMQLKLNQEDAARGDQAMPGAPNFVQGSGSGGMHISDSTQVQLAPGTMEILNATKLDAGLEKAMSGPRSSDMIPAIRGLSAMEFSQGSGSDVSMSNGDSILGKRAAGETEKHERRLDLSLALNVGSPLGGKPKRGRRGVGAKGQGENKDAGLDAVARRTRKKAATGLGAPGNLTRPNDAPRQEQ